MIRLLTAAALALGLLSGCSDDSGPRTKQARTPVTGLLRIAPAECSDASPSGSTFRMVTPGGTVERGPFVSNADSTCADKTWTPLAPGTAGGLRAGARQPQPDPAFGADGAGQAAAIVAPVPFFAVRFAVSTNAKDPQTGAAVEAPSLWRVGSVLHADLRSWSVAWNRQQFNQGAPKPDGSGAPGSGTIDPATGRYALTWTSTIAGGPFNGFTGWWHLEGVLDAGG